MKSFGSYIRKRRETLHKKEEGFSVRKVAEKIRVEPAFLSKVERDIVSPPSEAKIIALAQLLNEDPDILLAMAGKVSTDILLLPIFDSLANKVSTTIVPPEPVPAPNLPLESWFLNILSVLLLFITCPELEGTNSSGPCSPTKYGLAFCPRKPPDCIALT